jgi:hypothetical protein
MKRVKDASNRHNTSTHGHRRPSINTCFSPWHCLVPGNRRSQSGLQDPVVEGRKRSLLARSTTLPKAARRWPTADPRAILTAAEENARRDRVNRCLGIFVSRVVIPFFLFQELQRNVTRGRWRTHFQKNRGKCAISSKTMRVAKHFEARSGAMVPPFCPKKR